MAVHGYVTHAARNRRQVFFLALLYVVAFEIIGAFAAVFPLLYWDDRHTVLSDPLGYALRYGLPVAGIAIIVFGWLLVDHAAAVARDLQVLFVKRSQEPRFVRLAEEACTAQGVRAPRFGVIEAAEPNALSAGEGARGMIVVTRGLLDCLDDDELSAVLAHEAAHIRLGDTQALAANDALMRTAEMMQRRNPLRIEDKRQLVLLLLPPIAVLLLLSGALTMFALALARYARRGVRLARDHVADGEAVRATHFPEALISALRKIGGHGAFARSLRYEPLLFAGAADREGASHPGAETRIATIAALGQGLLNPARARLDTRAGAARSFGMGTPPGAARPFGRRTAAVSSDRAALHDMRAALVARSASPADGGWRAGDGRNMFGIKREMALPVAATLAASFGLLIYGAKDGESVLHAMNPARYAEVVQQANLGPFCSVNCNGVRRNVVAKEQDGAAPEPTQGFASERPLGLSEKIRAIALACLFVGLGLWQQKRLLDKRLPFVAIAIFGSFLIRIFSGGL